MQVQEIQLSEEILRMLHRKLTSSSSNSVTAIVDDTVMVGQGSLHGQVPLSGLQEYDNK
jgi:hypothetical protein